MLNWVIHLCYLLCLPEQLGLGSVYYIPPPFYKVMLLCKSNFLGWSDVHTVHLDSLSHKITGCYEVKHPLSTRAQSQSKKLFKWWKKREGITSFLNCRCRSCDFSYLSLEKFHTTLCLSQILQKIIGYASLSDPMVRWLEPKPALLKCSLLLKSQNNTSTIISLNN